jgi:hypothetical protein
VPCVAAALAGIEGLPWDHWGPARHFPETREITEDEVRQIGTLAEALNPAPATRQGAIAALDRFPWARPTETVSSAIVTTDVAVPILPEER